MIIYVAVKELFKCDIFFMHSLDKGLYCKIMTDKTLTYDDINKLKNKVQEIIDANYKIAKKVVIKKDAYNYYLKTKEYEKAGNILNLNNKTVTLYELLGYYNYFMDNMIDTTGEITNFDITYLENNDIILSYPITTDNKVPSYTSQEMILKSFTDYGKWCNSQNVKYVSDLNKIVSKSQIKDFIKKNDIIIDNQLYDLACTIIKEKKKIILLGGPSSSGKTTSTRKLSLYLSSLSANPIPISLDDYFKERLETPLDENGEYDFESLDAIDLELFNSHLEKLLNQEKVSLPTYNFLTGKKEYNNRVVELKENDIILIEGLHCLNEELTKNIPYNQKLKVYISPFMPLSIDRHNHLSTLDIRLLRRIVRDNRTRGYDVVSTLKSWESVRNGEIKYVFPFTNEANVILNTAYIYEVGILKVYAEPLLYSVPIDSKYYKEARRLLNELQMFFPIPSEYISDSNILREFIGESYFE
jgi:uridine kinase